MVQKCPVRQFEGPEFDRPACLGVDRLDHGEVLHEGDDAVFGRCDEQGLRQLGGGGLGIEAMPQQPAHGEHRELPRRDVRDAAVGTDQDDGVGLDLRRGQRGDAGTEAQAEQHQGSAGICLPGPSDDRDGVGGAEPSPTACRCWYRNHGSSRAPWSRFDAPSCRCWRTPPPHCRRSRRSADRPGRR